MHNDMDMTQSVTTADRPVQTACETLMAIQTGPVTAGFAAKIDLSATPSAILQVTGKVETNSPFERPVLWLDDKQIPMSRSLSLNLAIHKVGDIGNPATGLRAARFSYPATAGEFEDIRIFWGGVEIMHLQVNEEH